MTRNDILKQLQMIISQGTRGRIKLADINPSVDLVAEMGLDSIEALEIFLMLEEQFSMRVDDEDLNREFFRRLDNLVDYIQARSPAP